MKTPTIKDIRAAAAARQTRRRWRNRLIWGGGVILLLGAVLTLFVLPRVVRKQLETRLADVFGPGVSIGEVQVSVWQLAVTIDDTTITDRNGQPLLAWDRLRVNARAWALIRGQAGFDAIELDGFRGNVAVDRNGEVNFSKLMADRPATAESDKAEPLLWAIDQLAVNDARVEFTDQSRSTPFASTVGPLSFSLRSFHTRGDPQAPYNVKAVTEAGESLSWQGTLSVTPLRSRGTVEFSDLQLPKYAPYYAQTVNFDLSSGSLSGRAEYDLDFSGAEPVLEVRAPLVQVQALALNNRASSDPAVSADLIKLADVVFGSKASSLNVGQLDWVGGQIAVTKDDAGIDLQRWGAPTSANESAARVDPGSGLAVNLSHIKSDGLRLRWRDLTLGHPFKPVVATLMIDVKALNLAHLEEVVTVDVQANFASGGQLTLRGGMGVDPFRPTLKIETNALSLSPVSPYLQSFVEGRLDAGTMTMAGDLATVGEGLVFRGNTEIAGLKFTATTGEQIAGWEGLKLSGIDYSSNPAALAIESVRWIRPEGRLHIRGDGTLNWTSLAVAKDSAETSVVGLEPANSTDGAMELRVDRLELVDALVDFEDESLPKSAQLKLMNLSGTLQGLSSTEVGKAKAELSGKVDGVAPVKITGDFNPLGRPAYTNLKLTFNRIDLRALGGYASKYAGYNLDRGRLSLEVDFALQDRAIKSTTVATLDDFELGAKFDSPDATKLPVKLAVALLKDRDGQIVIDLPVEGELDDPKFRFGRVIGRVLINLLTKAATSPFALLGAAVGGGGEDLASHRFEPGENVLSPEAMEKLDTVAKALVARPALEVVIAGEFDSVADAAGLKPKILEEQLRATLGLNAGIDLPWTEKSRKDALIQRYLQVFGTPPIDAGQIVTSPAPVADVPPMETPATSSNEEDAGLLGLIRRLLGKAPRESVADGSSNSGTPASTQVEVEQPTRVEFAILPAEVIADALLEQIQVTDVELTALAEERAVVVRDYLQQAGTASTRITIGPILPGNSRVSLRLED